MPNHTDYFEKLMVNMLHRNVRVNDGLGVSKAVISTQDKREDKEHRKPPKKEMWNRKDKNNSPNKWVLVNKLF